MTAAWTSLGRPVPAPDERQPGPHLVPDRGHLTPALPEREALMSVMAEFGAAIIEGRPPLTDAAGGVSGCSRLLEAASLSVDNGGARIP